jgi:hypothetical protein
MTGQRKSEGHVGRGVTIAAGLSGAFLGLTVMTSAVVAALVVVPASIAVGVVLERRVPRATPHSLDHPAFQPVAVVGASRAAAAVSAGTASPAA